MTPPELLTPVAAAHYLGVSSHALRRLVDAGVVRVTPGEHGQRFARADLDAHLEASRVRPGELRHLYDRSSPAR